MESASVEEWGKVFDVNSTGVFLCYREAAKSMIERGIKGRIVGACSIAGKKSNFSNQMHINLYSNDYFPSTGMALIGSYGASKFAQRALTQVAACEWAQYGIRVNGYAPGPIDTTMRMLILPLHLTTIELK